jgi:CRP/FNR family transcriptional regulator, cyclic AMP receptor protein
MNPDVSKKIEKFFSSYNERSYAKGQIIIYAGDDPSGIFNIVKGNVRQYDIAASGDEMVVNVFKPPAFFPMNYAINRTPNKYFFETMEDVVLRQAPADDVLEFIKSNPDVMLNLLSRILSGSDGLLSRMAKMMGGNAYERVLLELIIAGKRFGEEQKDGGLKIKIPENELAKRSGLARETFNREMNKIKKRGLVTVDHGIKIKELNLLEKELDG